MMRGDGHQASTSTVERALRRRGLLLPAAIAASLMNSPAAMPAQNTW
jgi:hypothetical protein